MLLQILPPGLLFLPPGLSEVLLVLQVINAVLVLDRCQLFLTGE